MVDVRQKDYKLGDETPYYNKSDNKLYTGVIDSIKDNNYLVKLKDLGGKVVEINKHLTVRTCGVNTKRVIDTFFSKVERVRLDLNIYRKYKISSFMELLI